MQREIGNGSSQAGTHAPAEEPLSATLARVEHDVNDLICALGLLGVKRCSRCRHFFRCTDSGALFDYGELVCYGCIPDWWPSLSMRLDITDRERIEGKLASWLRKNHRAEVVKTIPVQVPDTSNAEFEIVVRCLECSGSGRLMEGERCRFCNGLGTVRIVVPK
jgi:hypothetical protein